MSLPSKPQTETNPLSARGREWRQVICGNGLETKTLADGRRVKFTYQELPADGAFITAQLAGNEVVYSVVLTKAKNPLSREVVENHFKRELSKK